MSIRTETMDAARPENEGLSQEYLLNLSPDELENLTPEQMRLLTPDRIDYTKFSTDQLGALSIAETRAKEAEALSGGPTHTRRGEVPGTPASEKRGWLGRLRARLSRNKAPSAAAAPAAPTTPAVEYPENIMPEAQVNAHTTINGIEDRINAAGGSATLRDIALNEDSTLTEDEAENKSKEEVRNLAKELIDARVSPAGPLMARLRSTLSSEDFDRVADNVYGYARDIQVRADLSPTDRIFIEKWLSFREEHGKTSFGDSEKGEDSEQSKEFQKLVAEALSEKSGRRISLGKAGEMVGKAWGVLDQKKFFGKAVTDIIVGGIAGAGVKLALGAATGGTGGALVGGAVGAVKAGIQEYRQMNRENSSDAEWKRKNLKEKLFTNKKRMAVAVGRGAAFGALGGAIGVEITDFFQGNGFDVPGLGNFGSSDHSETPASSVDIAARPTPTMPEAAKPDSTPVPSALKPGEVTFGPKPEELTSPTPQPEQLVNKPSVDESFTKPGEYRPGQTLTQGDIDQLNRAIDENARISAQNDILQKDLDKARADLDALRKNPVGTGLPASPATAALNQAPGGAPNLESWAQVNPKFPDLDPRVGNLSELTVKAGSNPWNETHAMLNTAFGRTLDVNNPADAEKIKEITKLIAKDSGIKVPGWGLNEGVDQGSIPPGFKLTVSDNTKSAIQAMLKK